MRLFLTLSALAALTACEPPPKPVEQPKPDPTSQDWYRPATEQLAGLNREAKNLVASGKFDPAGDIIERAQLLELRLLAAPRPTLAAMEAVSDLDDLYGQVLLHNRRFGWARNMFQKNVVRWKTWKPQTPETERRWRLAVSAVAECDRHLTE